MIERLGNRFGETLENFEAENMADKLDEMGLAVLIDGTQQSLGNVRVLFVEQLAKCSGLFGRNGFALLDFGENRILFGDAEVAPSALCPWAEAC